MSNPHYHRVCEFLNILVHECTNREAYDAAALIHTDDLGNWQPVKILKAIERVARRGIDTGHPNQPMPPLDVQHELLQAGDLKDEPLRTTWNNVISPGRPFTGGKHRLKHLAALIVDGSLRQLYADIYVNAEDAWTAPTSEIISRAILQHEAFKEVQNRLAYANSKVAGGAA